MEQMKEIEQKRAGDETRFEKSQKYFDIRLRISKRVAGLFIVAVMCISVAVAGLVLLFRESKPSGAAVWSGTAATSFAGGDGSEASPYLISNGEQLKYLANLVKNTNSTIQSTYNKNTVYYRMTADIELNNTSGWESWTSSSGPANSWEPIGATDSYRFNANFDGGGFAVRGMYIMYSGNISDTVLYWGLFGYFSNNGGMMNCGVEKSYINLSFNGGNIDSAKSIGGIAGRGYGMQNCYFTGKITVSDVNNSKNVYAYVGGVVGQGTAINCYNSGSLTYVGDSKNTSYSSIPTIGGITGMGGGISCYNTGNVTATCNNGRYSRVQAGGIAGSNGGNIANCYNSGAIQGIVNGSTSATGVTVHVGGIVGRGTVTNCYNEGSVTGRDNTSATYGTVSDWSYGVFVGGVGGCSGEIINCYSRGSIAASTSSNCNLGIGGIVGGGANGSDKVQYSYWLNTTATSQIGFDPGKNYTNECYSFTSSGAVTTSFGTTLLDALNGWLAKKEQQTGYMYKAWTGKPYPKLSTAYSITYGISYVNRTPSGSNSGTEVVTYTVGETCKISDRAYTSSGYVQKGWTTTAGGSSVTHSFGATYSGNADLTLYPVWEAVPATYTITYYKGSASGVTGPTSVAASKTANVTYTVLPALYTRVGYVQVGWATTQAKADAGIVDYAITGSATYTSNANLSLYPVWGAIDGMVTLHYVGGINEPESEFAEINTTWYFNTLYANTMVLPSVEYMNALAVAAGHSKVFVGWFEDAECTIEIVPDVTGKIMIPVSWAGQDKDVYAGWSS